MIVLYLWKSFGHFLHAKNKSLELKWSLTQAIICICHHADLTTMKYLQTKQLERYLTKSINYSLPIVWKAFFFVSQLYSDAGGVHQLGLVLLWSYGCFREEWLLKWRSQMQAASAACWLGCGFDELYKNDTLLYAKSEGLRRSFFWTWEEIRL